MSLRLRSHQQWPAELSRRRSGPRENILHGVTDLQRTIDRTRLPPEHVPTEPYGGVAGGVSELLFPSLYQRRDRCDRPSWTKASAALLNVLLRHRPRSISPKVLLSTRKRDYSFSSKATISPNFRQYGHRAVVDQRGSPLNPW